MGRKSSSKAQTRSSSPTGAAPPPADPGRSFKPLLGVALVVAVVALGAFVALKPAKPDPGAAPSTDAAPAAAQAPPVEPRFAKLGPHKQERLPPLPFDPAPPARPAEVVRAAYVFAAEHPEVLSYVPCYCGCERTGHHDNEDCFVTARDAEGDVTQWEPHGMT
jgi:Protein of unknown function with PCYCGC motif